MPNPARSHLLKAVTLTVKGIDVALDVMKARGADVDWAFKRRDRREPERRAKEAMDDALFLWLQRHFRRQAKQIREELESHFSERKAPKKPKIDWARVLANDEKEMALLVRLLGEATREGIALFGQQAKIGIDYSLTNAEAAEWARKYAFDFIKDIDATTVDILKNAITAFVETPGFTIGDIMDALPFDEKRSLSIAVTETTRAYAQGQQMAGDQLKQEFPDVRVVKIWFTNNDDLVCELCGPLEGVEVENNENFYEPGSAYEDGNPPRHPNCRCWVQTTTALAEL
jgi:hypothetical protein